MTAAATQPGELVRMAEGLGEWGPPGRADLDMTKLEDYYRGCLNNYLYYSLGFYIRATIRVL